MDSGRFGPPAGSTPTGDDRFGYFTGGPAGESSGSGTPAVNQFGALVSPPSMPAPPAAQPGQVPAPQYPQSGAPQSPFGGPTTYPAQYPAGPGYAGPLEPPKKPGTARWVAGVLVALMLAGGGWYGWNLYQRSRPVVMPATFAGQPQNLEPVAQTTDQTILASMKAANPGIQMNAQIYGTGKQAMILGVARGHEDVTKDLTGSDLTAAVDVGDARCAARTDGAATMCVRSAGNLTVIVLAFSGTEQATAALVDQAYSQF